MGFYISPENSGPTTSAMPEDQTVDPPSPLTGYILHLSKAKIQISGPFTEDSDPWDLPILTIYILWDLMLRPRLSN